MLSVSLRKRFVKDFSLPVPVLSDPYFDHYMALYDPLLDTSGKLSMLADAVNQYGGEDAFMDASQSLRQTIINKITNSDAYKRMQNDPLDHMKVASGAHQEQIYHAGNVNRLIISIDMKTANFQALRHYDPALVDDFTSFDAYVGQFSTAAYFREAKHLRQVVFGNTNPKKQQRISRCLLDKVVVDTLEAGVPLDRLRLLGNDEFVVYSSEKTFDDDMAAIGEGTAKHPDLVLRVEPFWLRRVHPDHDFFVKECGDNVVKFKNTPSFFFPQVVKYYLGKPIEPMDLTFVHENLLASFNEPLFTDAA